MQIQVKYLKHTDHFPGYKNLVDVDGDGFGDDIIDLSKNDGRADAFVSPNDLINSLNINSQLII